ncbi:acyltransferase family protein [Hirschia litorea]|uniref:Acyltransferase family protein n=1 Tax=Hirschia litorea TaxID=1199156 RepID=A0ABW2IHE1_9PROT
MYTQKDNPSVKSSLAYEPTLDGLRGIAVICVLLYHLGIQHLSGGFIGVDVFYVISGYLITKILMDQFDRKAFNYVDFVVRRARRLLPALFITIGFTLIGAFLVMSPKHFSSAADSAIFASLSVSNWFFWLDSDYFSASKHVRPLLHTWSLSVEVQFYLVWPLVIYGISRLGKNKQWTACFIMAGIGFVGFLSSVLVQSNHPSAAFFLSVFRVWQFAAGGCVALFSILVSNSKVFEFGQVLKSVLFALGMAILTVSLLFITSDNYWAVTAVLPTIGTVAVLLGMDSKFARLGLASRSLVGLGKISYSLYLVHWPIIILYRYWAFRPLNMWEIIACAVISIIAAKLLYDFVENRFRLPWTQKREYESSIVGARVSASILSIAFIGSLISFQQGWHWRLPVEDQLAQLNVEQHLECGDGFSNFSEDCSFGAQGTKPEIAVIGDSHALGFATGLDPIMKADNISAVLVKRFGTLPFHGTTTYGGEWEIGNFDEGLSRLSASPTDLIILHARFGQYWWSSDEDGGRPTWVGTQNESPQALDKSQAAFRQGLENTLVELEKTKASVVVIGAIPYPGLDSGQCLVRPSFIISEEHSEKSCTGLTQEQSVARAGAVNKILRARVEASGFVFIDPIDIFCRDGDHTCLRKIDGKVIYADGNHLNSYGANILAKHVWEKVKQAGFIRPTA